MIQKIRKLLFALFLFSFGISVFGQKNLIFTDADRLYKNGVELFNKEKYGAAQEQFNEAIKLYGLNNHEFKANSEYYSALCAIELFNDDAEYLMAKFIAERPENSKVNSAYFHMGKFQYRQNRFAKAIFWNFILMWSFLSIIPGLICALQNLRRKIKYRGIIIFLLRSGPGRKTELIRSDGTWIRCM